MERFCDKTARMAKSRVLANMNIAINSLHSEQENLRPYTLELPEPGYDEDELNEDKIEKGVRIARLLAA